MSGARIILGFFVKVLSGTRVGFAFFQGHVVGTYSAWRSWLCLDHFHIVLIHNVHLP